MGSPFIPRAVFPTLDSLPRSYFLGHHRSGLTKMKSLLSSIDLVIECRDYRVPLSSRNPLFESSLAGRERLVVYTKRDLGSQETRADAQRELLLRKWLAPSSVLFSDHRDRQDVKRILNHAKAHASALNTLTGSRLLIVGMPNVGKSSLLNALRQAGIGKGKAAHTGAQPGVTRKIGTTVKIVEGSEGSGEGIYLLDTPGVFVPYIPDAEAMLKLALCGSVKDTIIPPTTLADYLLYQMNRNSPDLYSTYHPPTNDITSLLEAVAQKTGRLQKGGIPDTEASALWLIQRWRNGHLGRFMLDEVTEEALRNAQEPKEFAPSFSQAKRADKDARRARSRSTSVAAA
ncbi:Mitochondrial GTPase 1 [Coniosporium tulheliwenetii]|uniref:Mitochondrial GTPase 1 n=1 Tax=Coniosporium tulheliwenetii TaxID=3383036 RepID=A0ACC2YVZ8_9PEZI|nr:Mitochondrial GTPase 1 [Cladosporium sp. JES 115]